MRCSGCGKNIPFTGTVCPYCHRDKSKDQKYMVLGFVFGLGLAFLGGMMFGVLGAIGGFVIGASLAYYVSGAGKTKALEVELKKLVSDPE
jgi:glutaredoxin